MKLLVVESWVILLCVDLMLQFCGFKRLHRLLHQRRAEHINRCDLSRDVLSYATDLACALYFRQVSPLERSAAAALLLRRHGWQADLVLALQIVPYEPYAWVEIGGRIVNDQPNLLEIYQVLDRC